MSDSEDGQLQSPGNDDDVQMSPGMDDNDAEDDEDDDEEERDADSLNIKPPQAIVTHNRDRGESGRRGKDKLSSKEKKHSKERRHKERNSLKEREIRERSERGERERGERDRRDYNSGGGGGGGNSSERRRDERGPGVAEMERYPVRGNYERGSVIDDNHDSRRGYTRHFERNEGGGRGNHYHHQHYHQQYHHIQHMQQRQPHHDYYERAGAYHHHSSGGGGGGGGGSGSGSGNLDYHGNRQYNKHSSSSGGAYGSGGSGGGHHDDGERDRDRERDRRKYASTNEQPAKDAESLEQDLRSRLLSKRHKYVRSSGGGGGGGGGGGVGDDIEERFDDAAEYEKSHGGERVRSRRDKKREAAGHSSVIEVLDSPEVDIGNHTKSRHRHRHRNATETSPGVAVASGGGISSSSTTDKRKTPDDPELLARRAKFLVAEREKELRKESAREELQARREMLRERERNDTAVSGALSPSAVAASVTAGLNVIKRKVSEESNQRQSKRKRHGTEKTANNVECVDEEDEHVESEHEESAAGDDDDDDDEDSVSLSPSEDDSDLSHSDSGAAVSVKSISPLPPTTTTTTKVKRKHKRHHADSERESSKSKDDNHELDDGNESEHSYYEKTKSKRKISKRIKASVGDAFYNNNSDGSAHSGMESRSASVSPAESEDSFYANRKREKRAKSDKDDEIDTSPERERRDKDVYRNSKALKSTTTHKSKKRSKTKQRDEDEEANGSPVSEGSVKAHRARKHRRKKSPGDDESPSKSEGSEMESEDSYYEKRKRHRHHRKSGGKDNNKKSKRISENSEDSVSSMSGGDTHGEDEDDDEFENGVHSNSGSDEADERKATRRRKYSNEANQFLADINDVDMKDLSKDGSSRKERRGNGTESGVGSGIKVSDEDEMETIYDDKGVPLPNYYPGIQGCRTVEEFQCLNRIEEGTYGVVYRARDQRTNEIVALKRLKMEKEREGFPITSLREINTLLKGQHPNIVTVREIVVGSNMDKIFIVMDYVEHDLKSLMETMKTRKQIFFPGEVKCLTQQLLRAVGHLHDNWILHRDLKTSNLLLSHKGILKVGDFGLAREYGSPLRKYTSLVVTRWYRAPELLLCSPMYSTPIDIWSVGCIFAEFLLMTPYLPGKSDIDQLNRIFRELGTPNEKIWPGYNELPAVKNVLSQNTQFADYPMSNLRKRFSDKVSDAGMSLLQGLLTYDPKQRLTAEAALEHIYFKELPLPIDPAMFPTWPAKSEMGSARKAAHSPKPPSGGAQFKQLGQDDIAISHVGKTANANQNNKVVSGIITGNKKTAANTGFVLNAGIDQRQLAMGPGFNLKF